MSPWLLLILTQFSILVQASMKAGVAIADVTGPIAEIGFMGYGKVTQKGAGLHTRQFSRAFIISDGSQRLVLVSVDCGMIGDAVKRKVVRLLQKRYGDLYRTDNVMISGSHTHSTPGGHLTHMLFDITILGFSKETFNSMVSGITKSIVKAHENVQPAKLTFIKGELLGANINRSPTAYLNNPEEERKRYKYNVDKDMLQLKIRSAKGGALGAISWFPVHPTSMNNTNTLVSSDNVGLASILFEQDMNPDSLIGKGPFVAAFPSTNLGDVSPNIRGPRCQLSGLPCESAKSTCPRHHGECIASGPGRDMFESTRIIGELLYTKAKELWESEGIEVKSPLRSIHQFVDMPTATTQVHDKETGELKTVHGCLPAMGYSFGAGTTDGPGASPFSQATTSSDNPLWNAFRDLIATPRSEDIECHAPKPILIPSGRMTFPYEWQPRIVSTQLALLENIALACVPGEFTTMSGRRLKTAINEIARVEEVIIVGLCNTYSDYIATYEEYQVQRYEGASTAYGPYTLDIYLNQYRKLTSALLQNQLIEPGPEPVNLLTEVISLIPPVIFDTAKWSFDFGNVTMDPQTHVRPGETVSARFVSGHPRNDPRHDDTYLAIERKESEHEWRIVATDANWETKFHWIRVSDILGTSEVVVEWSIPVNTSPGEYRIRHFGTYKFVLGGKYPYEGTSRSFFIDQ